MAVLAVLEGKDSVGDTSTAEKKSTHFITSHIQLGEDHNAIFYTENYMKNIVYINLLFRNSK